MANEERLGSAYVEIGAKVDKLARQLAISQRMVARAMNKNSEAVNKLATSYKKVGTTAVKSGAKVKASFKESLRSAVSMERVVNRLAFLMTVGLGYGAFRLIKRGFEESIGSAITFERQMAEVFTMLDKFGKIYGKKLTTGVMITMGQYGQSSKALTKGLYDILSASIDASKSIDVLRVASKAATAGMTETSVAADAITSVLNAYQMSADQAGDVSDWLFAIVKRGKITFPELAGDIGKVISTAGLLGVSLEEVGTSIGTMTRQGVKSREAMTALNRLLLAFADPTDQAMAIAKKYGFELNAATLRAIGLTGVIKKLTNATEEEMITMATTVRAFKALAAGAADVEGQIKDMSAMTHRAGKTQDAFNIIAETTSHKAKAAGGHLKNMGIVVGGLILELVQAKPLLDAFNEAMAFTSYTVENAGKQTIIYQNQIKKVMRMSSHQLKEYLPKMQKYVDISNDATATLIKRGDAHKDEIKRSREVAMSYLLIEKKIRSMIKGYEDLSKKHGTIPFEHPEPEEDDLIVISEDIYTVKERLVDLGKEFKHNMDVLKAWEILGEDTLTKQKSLWEDYIEVIREEAGEEEAIIEKGQMVQYFDNISKKADETKLKIRGAGKEFKHFHETLKIGGVEINLSFFSKMSKAFDDLKPIAKDSADFIQNRFAFAINQITLTTKTGAEKWKDIWNDLMNSIWNAFAETVARMIALKMVSMLFDISGVGVGASSGVGHPGLGGSPSLSMPTGTYAPNIINNNTFNPSMSMRFSPRDMGFIVDKGLKYNNKTRL